MREHKFRGKRVDNDEWEYGSLITVGEKQFITNDCEFDIALSSDFAPYCEEVIPETVGEFTGLYDCKRTEQYPEGQEIYEGDIVKNCGYDELCIVEYYQGQYIGRYSPQTPHYDYDESLKITKQPRDLSYVGLGFYVCERNSIEVIGNIHDNPKLMEVPHD